MNSCVLVNVGDLFWGHQMWAWMPPGTTNIAQTLVIHCVSAHALGSHQTTLRTVAPQSLPNTVNSCGFASSADIGMQSGVFWGVRKRSPTFTNTWEFMLFRVVATQCVEPKMQHNSSTTWRKTFEFSRVGACWRCHSDQPTQLQHAPGIRPMTQHTMNFQCLAAVAHERRAICFVVLCGTCRKHNEFKGFWQC